MRRASISYRLPSGNGDSVNVCQKMFLGTLGYKGNKVIVSLLKTASLQDDLLPQPDRRGKKKPPHALTVRKTRLVQEHIMSYRPAISHYRREHAPRRLYLTSEITVQQMYDDFSSTHPDMKIVYDTYRKHVKSLNIGFTKLGEEECEECVAYHIHQEEGCHDECVVCAEWHTHIERAKTSRNLYQEDVVKSKASDSEATSKYVSVDLQKVVLLPRLPGLKSCMFTRRLVAFHLTFAPLGGVGVPKGLIWHEGICGRGSDDITSAYITAL
jgi:hypothetical protein